MTGGGIRLGGWRRVLSVAGVALLLILDCAVVGLWATGSWWWSDASTGGEKRHLIAAGPPPSAPDPGVLVRSRLTAGTDLMVTQWLRFDGPVGQVRLSMRPAVIGASDAPLEVRRLRVVADGRRVHAPAARLAADRATVLDLGLPAQWVRLDYRAEGAVQRSPMSAPRRAIADVTPVHVSMPQEATRVIEVIAGGGGAVLSMACGPAGELPAPCGRNIQRGWTVRLSGTASQEITASVDLPLP